MDQSGEELPNGPIQLSTGDFRKQLDGDLRKICGERGWKYDHEGQRGWAFQFWIAAKLRERDRGIETDPEDGVLLTREGGIDIVLEDPTEHVVYVVQTKLVSTAQQPPIAREEVEAFFAKHELLLDRAWAKKNISHKIIDQIGYYNDLFTRGYKVLFYFISTGRDIDDKCQSLVDSYNTRHKGIDVEFNLMDFTELKRFYIEALTLDQAIPAIVEFHLIRNGYFIKEKPRKTLVATVKASQLKNLYHRYKETLFSYNIRSFLGRKGLNRQIIETAENVPDDFFYFNNGISATCISFDIDADRSLVRAEKFQIINGAQTIGALANASIAGEVEVLVRITQGETTSTEKGFNAEVVKYNNTQNVVRAADFRSNDPVQIWLDKKFNDLRPIGAVPGITYMRKRSSRRARRNTQRLTLEELAKIRYAWLYDPTICVADPKSLWTSVEDGGVYEKSFGIDGTLLPAWTDEHLNQTIAAVIFYWEIEGRIDALRKKDKTFLFLRRLRYFALGLVPIFMQVRASDPVEFIYDEEKFQRTFKEFWNNALRELNSLHHSFVEEQDGTLFALARSEQRWGALKRQFERLLAMQDV